MGTWITTASGPVAYDLFCPGGSAKVRRTNQNYAMKEQQILSVNSRRKKETKQNKTKQNNDGP
jgi:hypothetical protein